MGRRACIGPRGMVCVRANNGNPHVDAARTLLTTYTINPFPRRTTETFSRIAIVVPLMQPPKEISKPDTAG